MPLKYPPSKKSETENLPYSGLTLERVRIFRQKNSKSGSHKVWCAFRLYPEIFNWLTQYHTDSAFIVNLALEEFYINHKDELIGKPLEWSLDDEE